LIGSIICTINLYSLAITIAKRYSR
jgi:hypothetical protein